MRTFTATCMGFVLLGLLGSGCASDDLESIGQMVNNIPDAAADGAMATPDASVTATGGSGPGSCDPRYCPSDKGTACCVAANGPCGYNYGMGCVAAAKDGG